jgi:hypothetical protein
VAYVKYNIYLWGPPTLTPEQEIEIGREIALRGRDYFRQRAPYLSNEEQQRIEDAKHYTRGHKIKIIVVAILLFGPCIVFISRTPRIWVPFLIALVPILVLSLGSLLHARARYHKWINEMLAKYATHVASNSAINRITSETIDQPDAAMARGK